MILTNDKARELVNNLKSPDTENMKIVTSLVNNLNFQDNWGRIYYVMIASDLGSNFWRNECPDAYELLQSRLKYDFLEEGVIRMMKAFLEFFPEDKEILLLAMEKVCLNCYNHAFNTLPSNLGKLKQNIKIKVVYEQK